MSKKRLLIIQPAHYRSKSDLTPHKTRRRNLVGLTLPYLAALTPPDWEVSLIDEQLMDIDFNAPVDLVAISVWTINSLRAYEIGDAFRERGVAVITGGPHTYFYGDESALHSDAVGIGEAETIWQVMLEDAASARLKKFYRADHPQDLSGLPIPRHNLLDLRKYGFIKTFSVQASRGCPFHCEFCSERFYLGQHYRNRPALDVVEEIKQAGVKHIFFADSNFAGKPAHTMALMEALIPLRIRWSSLFPAYLCNNREFMDLAKRSGLLHVNIGIESIDQSTLAGLGKKNNNVRHYGEILRNLRERQISYSLNFIFGWDSENSHVFPSTMAFLEQEKVPAAYFNILTPHRGTPLYDRMLAEGRIIDPDHIGRWPGISCHIRPTFCSAKELEQRVKELYYEFYKYPSMLRRLPLPLNQAHVASWFINLSQRKASRALTETEAFDDY